MPKSSIPTKKLNNGFEMPVFGIGTWTMGSNSKADIKSIQAALDMGIRHIDTAENYADGAVETIVGQAIKDYKREDLFLVSKVDNQHLEFNDLLASAHASLKRLGTDYFDLFLVHSPNPEIPLKDTMKAMDMLVTQQVVRNIGVSNFTTKRLIQAQKLTKHNIVVNQVYYNLLMREPEHEGLLEYCQKNDIFLEAYRPLEKGKLLSQSIPLLEDLAKKYKKTPTQIALNWLISQKNVVTLSKASQAAHLKENIAATQWTMKEADIEQLRVEFPNQVKRSERLPLI